MDRTLIKDFFNCGDDQIIQFAIVRAHLNKKEHDALHLILDECLTQEEAAETIGISTRRFQEWWYSATDKMLNIPWVYAYAKELRKQ